MIPFKATRLRALVWAGILVSVAVANAAQGSEPIHHQAVRGVLDLRGWDFQHSAPIELDGQWEFYWQQLLGSADFRRGASSAQEVDYLAVPGSWTGRLWHGNELPGEGYATYRLKVLVDKPLTGLALKIDTAGTAYAVIVDGIPVAGNGQVGASAAAHRPEFRPQVFDIPNLGPESEWILQVSNFSYRKGGPWHPLMLGNAEDMHRTRERIITLEVLVIGGLLIIGFYQMVVFALRTKDRSTIWFALFSLTLAVREAATGQRVLLEFAKWTTWGFLIRAELISIFLILVFGPMYVSRSFPGNSLAGLRGHPWPPGWGFPSSESWHPPRGRATWYRPSRPREFWSACTSGSSQRSRISTRPTARASSWRDTALSSSRS